MNFFLPLTLEQSSADSPIAEGKSYIDALATSMPYNSQIKLWNSKSDCNTP